MNATYSLKPLGQLGDLESKAILKAAAKAQYALGKLEGLTNSLPNPQILLATLSLREAQESSAIENIITTQDDLYQSNYKVKEFATAGAKEVHSYAAALLDGYNIIKRTGLLTNNTLVKLQAHIEGNNAGFRKQAGTALVNEATQEVVYTPPQTHDEVVRLMADLEAFINDDTLSDYDDLVKMTLIHHRFESIHPFYDGNGRTGRILNILYLSKQGLLDAPILYLSSYLNRNKGMYYKLLQQVRNTNEWEAWILFMLEGIRVTSLETLDNVNALLNLMDNHKQIIRNKLPKIYSYELVLHLFTHPYTKVDIFSESFELHRNTARRHLNQLEELGVLTKVTIGNEHFYVNSDLFNLLGNR
ncbi:MAG: Fic family protein [Psychromonas sp.]|jgi:Fic family protein|uniref:Fic family protein n=1 Tax=Psychromonas sp. TaxID=1884585 RepID=UPI0039E39749